MSASADAVGGDSTGDAPLVKYEFVGIQELSWWSALCFKIVSKGTKEESMVEYVRRVVFVI